MFFFLLAKCVCVGALLRTLLSKSEVFTQALMTYSSESTRPSQMRICFLASSPAELRFLWERTHTHAYVQTQHTHILGLWFVSLLNNQMSICKYTKWQLCVGVFVCIPSECAMFEVCVCGLTEVIIALCSVNRERSALTHTHTHTLSDTDTPISAKRHTVTHRVQLAVTNYRLSSTWSTTSSKKEDPRETGWHHYKSLTLKMISSSLMMRRCEVVALKNKDDGSKFQLFVYVGGRLLSDKYKILCTYNS